MIGKAISTKENESEGGFYYDWNFYCTDFRRADERAGGTEYRSDQAEQYMDGSRMGTAFGFYRLPCDVVVRRAAADRGFVADSAKIHAFRRGLRCFDYLYGYSEYGQFRAGAGGASDCCGTDYYCLWD